MSSSHRNCPAGAFRNPAVRAPHPRRTPARTRRVAALLGTAVALAGTVAAVPATAQATGPDAVKVGAFNRNLIGASVFRQTGTAITVNGAYVRLAPRSSFFTVIYANGNCDPAQAFPVGPFQTNRYGIGTLRMTVSGAAGLVAGSKSISVRNGDDSTDRDGDGLTGPTDVVAVAGQPSVGLVECDPALAGTG